MIDGTYTEGKPITLHVALDTKHFQCKNILLSKYNDFKVLSPKKSIKNVFFYKVDYFKNGSFRILNMFEWSS